MESEQESRKLRITAQNTRLQTIRTELALAFTWCAVARTENDFGERERFGRSLQKIKRAAASLRQRIFEPQHVPLELRPQFEAQLTELDKKIEQLESGHLAET